ncbi:hypothetical protein [Spirosoma oryzicola]|uniref:hypothetical protein n=1 Tax=Spirosoma oryzicola TaxID=2898794 RepID=UPI001E3328F1|nr:hypothetical protein [Spirosoma oryzicola]UHG91753.1 hypothetical protein LQ777_02375 [Spirosoma oryzicola]
MNDSLLLQPIDEHLKATQPGVRTQFAGRVEQFYDPQLRRPGLMRFDSTTLAPSRYTIDTVNFDLQVAHRLTGGQPVKSPTRWGSRQQIAFDLYWTLICATKRPGIITQFLLAFSHMNDLEVSEFSTDTLSILKRDFLFSPDGKTPYDPQLQCFSIQYRMLNISEEVFSSLCNSFS